MALKGTTIESVHIDVTAFKHEDTTIDFHINLSNIYGDPVRANSSHTFTAKVANKSGYLADFPCAIDGTDLLIDSDEFFKLAPDNYLMEIWETWTNEDGKKDTAIYPSPSQVLQFTINPNIEDKTGKIIETIDFKTTIENTVKDFLKNHPGAGTGQDIDLSDYYKKSDIDRRFATKDSVPTVSLDADQRKLTVNDKTIDIPDSVDLSSYAKKDAVPSVVYDADKHLLTINGQEVALSADVDLSNYYTKSEVDSRLSNNKVDLTGYLKATDAETEFAKKIDLPDMSKVAKKVDVPTISIDKEKRTITLNGESISIPDTVDLSGYAKTDELPEVELDVENRTITVNGKALVVPKEVDLSGYYTKNEVDDKLAKAASGGKVDLTGYLTKTEAGQTYATKSELPDMTNVATKDEIPNTSDLVKEEELSSYALKKDVPAEPDLSEYAKKSDVPSVEGLAKESDIPKIVLDTDKRTLTINNTEIAIPDSVDLSHFYTKDEVDAKITSAVTGGKVDLSGYLTKVNADNDYLAKDAVALDLDARTIKIAGKTIEIPNSVDLSGYLKSADAQATYATKSELPDMSAYAKADELSDYAKKTDIPAEPDLSGYALKKNVPDISLDTEKRTLIVNGTAISVPDSVDLSGYAKKSELPNIILDINKRSLSINGKSIDIPSTVDLSGFYTKSEVDGKISTAVAGNKVDLTGYLTKTEASKTYATKAELPDMSNVATKDELPSTEGLAKESELQDYAKKTDIPAAPDLTPYLKSVDADKKYAAKSDIPSLDDYAKKTDLPKEPDLSGYETKQEASDTFATKAEVPSIEGLAKEADVPKVVLDVTKRTLTINGQTVDIPGNVDLSHFYTKDEVDKKLTDIASGGKVDLTGYLTKVAADDSYLAKDSIVLDTDKRILKLGGQTINIPSSVDLSGYLTKTDAEEIYAKKATLDSYLTQTTASATYATKAEIPVVPDMSQYAKKSEIPKAPDLSQYAKNSDVAMVDNKAAAAMDKAVAALAAADKASSGAKIDYDKLYDGFADKLMNMKF